MPDERHAEVEEVEEIKEVKEKSARIGPVATFRHLLVYQQAYRLAVDARISQARTVRAWTANSGVAPTVAANIVEEWSKRSSTAEFQRHLVIASGETAETKF